MGQKNFKFEISDLNEEMSGDDRKVASMLGALKRVGAPADFDLRLKGRIARGTPSSGSMIAPWLRFAALPVLLLGLAGFLAFNGVFTFEGEDVPPVVETRFQPPELPIPAPTVARVEVASEPGREDVVSPAPVEAASETTIARRDRRNSYVRQSDSRSFDSGLGISNKVIQPRGFPVVQPTPPSNQRRPDGFQDRGISVKEILSSLGVTAEKSADGWTVKSIRAKSQAEKAGVQASDVVEAIGNHSIKDKESLSGNVSADSITLVRGGKRLTIKLTG